MDLHVYSTGVLYTSVCVSIDATPEWIEEEVNRQHPTGIASGWKISSDKTFRSGELNPHPCENNRNRIHYLLSC